MKSWTRLLVLMTVSFMIMAVKPKPCGKFKGHNIYKGEKGGCYYLKTKSKVKVYIDRKYCKC